MMTLYEFREDLINDIKSQYCNSIGNKTDLFTENVKDILINDLGLLSDLDITFYEYKTTNKNFRNMRLDASYLELSLNTLFLLYSDFNENAIEIINNEFVTQKANLLLNFFINTTKGFFNKTAESAIVTQLAENIEDNIDSIKKIHLIIISTNKNSTRLKTVFSMKPLILDGKQYDVDLTLLDIEAIYQTRASTYQKEDILIDTSDYGLKGIPCIKANIDSTEYDSYLAIVPGKFLSDIYMKYSARLLEGNVRSFLNTRGTVNKQILNTILNYRDKFFAYNNGICTIAEDVDFISNKNGLFIKSFKNLQIINGGQTTASLASSFIKENADLNGIYVQMKLSIIKKEEEKPELIRLIAKYANSQNKVTNADLNSNHPFYQRIEDYSRKTKAPLLPNSTVQSIWFFERARGQYDQAKMKLKTKKDREIFETKNPKAQKFTKTDLAKYINSDAQEPFNVSWGAEVNMLKFQEKMEKSWDKDNKQYNEIYYKNLIAKAILFRTIEKIISNEDWYLANKGYRAQLVTYTFSKFIYEIRLLNKFFNYRKVWEKQSVPEEYYEDLANIAKMCFDTLYNPDRQHKNIGEYAKRKICWEDLNKNKYKLSESTINLLIEKEDLEAENNLARYNQTVQDEVFDEIKIFELGINYWNQVKERGKQLKELSAYEIELCDIAIGYIKQIYRHLTKRQVKELSQIIKRMEAYLK